MRSKWYLRRMRVLVPGPAFDDTFQDNVAATLLDMGHEVAIFRQSLPHYFGLMRYAFKVAEERLVSFGLTTEDRAILRRARAFRPDLVLALTWHVHPEVLQALGKLCPGRRILWWGDAPANDRRWGLANPEWDRVYVKDPDAVRKVRLLGTPADLLHEAMNPQWHRPIASYANDNLVIAGNYYAFRQALIRRLNRDGVPLGLYGAQPPGWSLPEVRRLYTGRYITREAKSRVFGEGLACLNTTAFAEGNSLNCRAFEIAGCGGLQLIESRPIIESCFEPGRELLAFATYEELLGHLDRAKRFPAEMVAIREAGARRALAEHTYAHRLQHIIDAL